MTDPQRNREQSVHEPSVHNPKAVTERSRVVSAPELAHHEVRHLLSDYLDGDLPVGEQERVQHHLDNCPDCHAFMATLRKTARTLEALPRPAAPLDARRRLVEALNDESDEAMGRASADPVSDRSQTSNVSRLAKLD
ncbi:MAG TPA: zf-HC2 domain-containing protein [Chloroflexota bacterium]|nr:zf-HC2 domain-containing protein [Chloroflexota bacterium]